jgi:selenocysteine lyase/cysteine desulfurase
VDDIEIREDGGTPGFLQAIRTALCVGLKEQMGVDKILRREKELIERAFAGLRSIDGLSILADDERSRIGVFSFYIKGVHHNLIVKLLNDRFGIQVRGGCSCAGTYGHFLLNVDFDTSHRITEKINRGDLSEKPGWVRMSVHPTMTNNELDIIIDAILQVAQHADTWITDYEYVVEMNEFFHKSEKGGVGEEIGSWFKI